MVGGGGGEGELENGFVGSGAKGLLLGEGTRDGSCSVVVSMVTGTLPFLETCSGSNSDRSCSQTGVGKIIRERRKQKKRREKENIARGYIRNFTAMVCIHKHCREND